MATAAQRVQQLANDALGLLAEDKHEEARARVRGSLPELNPLRVRMNELMSKLYDLRARFIDISGVS